jgi:hypothetical protein
LSRNFIFNLAQNRIILLEEGGELFGELFGVDAE